MKPTRELLPKIDAGQALVEYILIIVLIALFVLAAFTLLSQTIWWNAIENLVQFL